MTANDYAKFAAHLGQLAAQIAPLDTDPYAQTCKLIQYHLRSAASKAKEIAEALALQEPDA